jgi:hypothetical protein
MKTFYYEIDEDNRIVWIDEVNRANGVEPEIISFTIELESIEDIQIWHDKIINGKIVKHIFDNIPVQWEPEEELQQIQQWFLSTDWIPNKIIREEWTKEDPRWIEYVETSLQKRTRMDEINLILNKEKE